MEAVVANPVASSSNRARETRRRKKKIKTHHTSNPNNTQQIQKTTWKSETTQQLYSTKLLQALRHVRLSSPPRRGRAVREAADRVLAIAARGKTRWSHAILSNRLRLKLMNKKHKRSRRPAVVAGTTSRLPRKPRVEIFKLKGKGVSAVQRKVKTLGKLVPGCRKEALPVILEEATDYIPALEMQIRAMREILSRLSATSDGNELSTSSSGEPMSEDVGLV